MFDGLEVKFEQKNLKTKIVRPDETDIIKCSNCNKELVQIHVTKLSSEAFYKMVVECPFCKDKSWEYDIKGRVGVRPCAGVALINIDKNDQKMINYYRTEKLK
jgi:hypothetical protein